MEAKELVEKWALRAMRYKRLNNLEKAEYYKKLSDFTPDAKNSQTKEWEEFVKKLIEEWVQKAMEYSKKAEFYKKLSGLYLLLNSKAFDDKVKELEEFAYSID